MSIKRSLFMNWKIRMKDRILRTHGGSQPVRSKSKTSIMSSLERDQLGQRGNGDAPCVGLLRGLDHIRDPQLNKVGSSRLSRNDN
ncbi:hypothetical protein EAI_16305 [Harpegnathos saltator]|uniref:Uncharacterized protein n=1 Tax=Harpegnathos saltator TaxID=610380 RepID=E2BX12_HARSA|nr:hypothetical protein EAI_16305 [Harpegnathos saltator]